MLELPLHAGTEHPNLWLIAIPALVSFVLGLALGSSADRLRDMVGLAERPSNSDRQ